MSPLSPQMAPIGLSTFCVRQLQRVGVFKPLLVPAEGVDTAALSQMHIYPSDCER